MPKLIYIEADASANLMLQVVRGQYEALNFADSVYGAQQSVEGAISGTIIVYTPEGNYVDPFSATRWSEFYGAERFQPIPGYKYGHGSRMNLGQTYAQQVRDGYILYYTDLSKWRVFSETPVEVTVVTHENTTENGSRFFGEEGERTEVAISVSIPQPDGTFASDWHYSSPEHPSVPAYDPDDPLWGTVGPSSYDVLDIVDPLELKIEDPIYGFKYDVLRGVVDFKAPILGTETPPPGIWTIGGGIPFTGDGPLNSEATLEYSSSVEFSSSAVAAVYMATAQQNLWVKEPGVVSANLRLNESGIAGPVAPINFRKPKIVIKLSGARQADGTTDLTDCDTEIFSETPFDDYEAYGTLLSTGLRTFYKHTGIYSSAIELAGWGFYGPLVTSVPVIPGGSPGYTYTPTAEDGEPFEVAISLSLSLPSAEPGNYTPVLTAVVTDSASTDVTSNYDIVVDGHYQLLP